MPRGKNGKPEVKEAEWGGFIDLRLNDEERAQFEQFAASFEWAMIEDIMADDVKLSVAYDKATDCYLATFTSTKHAGANVRCVLTARADDWQRAVALLCYKHLHLLEGDWGRFKPSTGRAAEV